ncbi:MAG: SCP-like extracellular [Actinomycetia bacterium]|nr:SCP-like extracellular [Actinomycetes bacterium]
MSWRAVVALAAACLTLAAAGVANASPTQPRATVTSLSGLEQGVLASINAFRTANKLSPLILSASLTTAAREHSQQMAEQGYFQHESADGSAFWKRLQRFYPSSPWRYWSVGENLLWSSPDVDANGALQMWLNSPEHKANLLTARWREIGVSAVHVAAAPGTFHGLDVTIVTTDFGIRR